MKLKIVTVVSDESNEGFQMLRLSCIVNKLSLTALKWSNVFASRRIKDILLFQYLGDLKDDDLLLFTDGYDSILLASEEEIIEKYNKFDKKVIFSAESNCWPDANLSRYFSQNAHKNKFLNSGGFIGPAGILRDLIDDELYEDTRFFTSNQYVWTKRFLKHPDIIELDHTFEIFSTFSPELGCDPDTTGIQQNDKQGSPQYYLAKKEWFKNNYEVKKNRIYSKTTSSWPSVVHFNGRSMCLMDGDIYAMIINNLNSEKLTECIEFSGEFN